MQQAEIVAMPHTPEWYAARNTGIGASEIAAAAGLGKDEGCYQTGLEVFLRKLGRLPPLEETEPMIMGRLLEPVVLTRFHQLTQTVPLDPHPPMFRNIARPWMTATPDTILSESELVEAKTTTWRMESRWNEEDTDQIPGQYLCQCQWQMAVIGDHVKTVFVPVLFDGAKTKIYRVDRNQLMIGFLIDAGTELWERIQNDDPPEPNWEHASTPKIIREMHSEINGQVIELEDITANAWLTYEQLGKLVKDINDRRERYKSEVLYAIGGNYAGDLGDGRIVRRKLIEKKGHVVGPSSYIDFRAVKKPN
jgi:putative phage-type endonuclease